MNITDNSRKKAILLHFAGADVMDIYENLSPQAAALAAGDAAEGEENAQDQPPDPYAACKQVLEKHFNPQSNVTFHIYQFRQMKQNTECLDDYVAKLRQAANLCEFHNADLEIKSQLIVGCVNSHLRRKVL